MEKQSERFWVGLDIGATKMRAIIFNGNFKPLARAKRKTRGNEGAAAGMGRAFEVIREALAEAGLSDDRVTGIGLGCPGPLHLDDGVILDAPNLGWKNVKVKNTLEKEFHCPVAILNDVDAGVYGEFRFGAARGARCAVGVFPGTGVGGGCVYQGELLRGSTGSCMEIGHIQVIPDGPVCGCGRRGCLEAVAGRLAIASQAAAAAYRGDAPYLLEAAGTDIAAIRSGVIAAAIEQGDVSIEKIVRGAARWIGVALGSVVNLLAPDIVLIGGGLVEAMPKLFSSEIETAARENCMPAYRKNFAVVVAKLGADAVGYGAAGWAEHLLPRAKKARD